MLRSSFLNPASYLNYFSLTHLLSSVLLLCLSVATVHASSEWQHERDVYKQARTALTKKQINQYHKYLAQLTEYPLYQYLIYNEMRMRISKLSDDEVDEFLAKYSDGPLATRLRLAWLSQLQRKGRAESFLKYYQNEQSAMSAMLFFALEDSRKSI